MGPIISLLTVLTFSLVITRFATVALALTGLSRESARFQARSAFTGVGFTTAEAENVVNHPVRRRILMALMLTGNAGIVTVMASLILGFVNTTGTADTVVRIAILLGGLLVLLALSMSQWVERKLDVVIHWALERWTDLDVRDYASLFQFSDGYAVSEVLIAADDWVAGKTLQEAALAGEGVLVLGIHHSDGTYVGAPTGESRVRADDRLIVYGRVQHVKELDCRRRGLEGERAHEEAVIEQARVLEEQAEKEAALEQDVPAEAAPKAD